MRYAMIAAALVGAAAAVPAWAPPAYGGDEGSWGSTSTAESTTVVTVTSCGPEVPDCPGNSPPTSYPTTSVETTGDAPPPPYTWAESSSTTIPPPVTSAYSTSESTSVPPPPSTYVPPPPPYTSVPPPVSTSTTEGSPIPPPYTAPPPASSGVVPPPVYPPPGGYPHGNGTWGAPSGTAAPTSSATSYSPIEQTGNVAAGVKAGSFIAGVGAFAALFL